MSSSNIHPRDGSQENFYKCGVCTMIFPDRRQVRLHIKENPTHKSKHPTGKSLKCSECGDTFLTPHRLKRHFMIHTGERPYQCEECGVRFREYATLTTHKGIHLARGPYPCHLCGQVFTRLNSLTLHKRVHNTEGAYDYVPFKVRTLEQAHKKDTGCEIEQENQLHKHLPEVCGMSGTERRWDVQQSASSALMNYYAQQADFIDEPNRNSPLLLNGSGGSTVAGEEVVCTLSSTNVPYNVLPTEESTMSPTIVQRFLPNIEASSTIVSSMIPGCDATVTKSCSPSSVPPPDISFNVAPTDIPVSSTVPTPDKLYTVTKPDIPFTVPTPEVPCPMPLTNLPYSAPPHNTSPSIPSDEVVQEMLATGTILESQGQEGQGYLIVLPKTLANNNYTLITIPPAAPQNKCPDVCDNLILPGSDELGENNCDLLVWEDNTEPVPIAEIALTTQNDILADKKPVKPRKRTIQEVSADEESTTNYLPLRKSLNTQRKFKKLIKRVKIRKTHECQQCRKLCKSSSSLSVHWRTHTGERPYYCDYCHAGFKQLAHLRTHVRTHTGEQPYQCHMCPASFTQSSTLKSHLGTHRAHKVKPEKVEKQSVVRNFYCKICDKTFLDSCYKKQHMKTHIEETKFNCDKCHEQFKSRSSLRSHRRNHIDDTWSVCEECGLQFRSIKDLDDHVQMVHFKAVKDTLHEETKGNNSVAKVDESEAAFQAIVTDIEPATCTSENIVSPAISRYRLTGISRKKKSKLTESISGTNLFTCKICFKNFRQKSNLQTHVRIHTDERPYRCDTCNRAFKQISHLKDHHKTHTGEKPFMCSKCLAAFPQSSAVKYHINKVHSGAAQVVRATKDSLDPDQDSIALFDTPQLESDTVVISVDKSMTFSVERQKPNCRSTTVNKKCLCKEHGMNVIDCVCFSNNINSSVKSRCSDCNQIYNNSGIRNIAIMSKIESLNNFCEGCLGQRKVCPESIHVLTDYSKGKQITPQNCLNDISVFDNRETQNKQSIPLQLDNCRLKAIPSRQENVRPWSTNTGHACNICGKSFRRASALKFHTRMSHEDAYVELIED